MRSTGFEWDGEITAKLGSRRLKILEVPISYHGRRRREGKKIQAKDFFRWAWALFRCRFSLT